MNASPLRRRVSRILHWIDNQSSQTGVAVVASLLVVTSVVALAVDGFPTRWENAFSVVGTAIALIMLFVIQHTQSRHQSSLQLKLDELIRSSPGADDQLVRIEVADDSELDELTRQQQAHHESIREGDTLEIIEFTRRDDE